MRVGNLVVGMFCTLMAVTAMDFAQFRAGSEIHGPLGGAVKEVGEELELSTSLVQLADGAESWEGCLVARARIPVLPGCSYKWQVGFMGSGQVTVGVFEYPGKYRARLIGQPGVTGQAAAERTSLTLEYTPTGDEVAWVRPFVRVTGWHDRLRIGEASFDEMPPSAPLQISLPRLLASPGDTVSVFVLDNRFPVKLLLYGPDGTVGLNLPMGGSGAFTDHFVAAFEALSSPFDLPLPADAREGSYRVVAVNPATRASAEVALTVRQAPALAEDRRLAAAVALPAGSTLAFVGDSLTANFPGRNYPALLERLLHEAHGDRLRTINAGIGGDNILRIAKRLDRDVIDRHATHVILFEGANDCKVPYDPATGATGQWAVPPDAYEPAFRETIAKLQAAGVTVIVATCAPGNQEFLARWEAEARLFGDKRNFFCRPDEVAKLVAIQKRVAGELGCQIIDTNLLLAGLDGIHVDDGVHLNEAGAFAVARIFLQHLASLKQP